MVSSVLDPWKDTGELIQKDGDGPYIANELTKCLVEMKVDSRENKSTLPCISVPDSLDKDVN